MSEKQNFSRARWFSGFLDQRTSRLRSAGAVAEVGADLSGLFAPAADVRCQVSLVEQLTHEVVVLGFVQADALRPLRRGVGTLNWHALDRRLGELAVVAVGAIGREPRPWDSPCRRMIGQAGAAGDAYSEHPRWLGSSRSLMIADEMWSVTRELRTHLLTRLRF
jgi:hypothetical protein